LEFVASAVRATGADVDDALPLARQLNNMGMPLYGAQPPTGYSMKADTWVSSSALLNRMNFALALTSGKVRGVKIDATQLGGTTPSPIDTAMVLNTMETKLLASDVSKQTHDSIMAQIAPAKSNAIDQPDKKQQQKPPDASTIAGLLLGSPEFQRR
jgi:signal recognition particle GTPase